MSRVKLTEFRAKSIILGDSYRGISIHGDGKLVPLESASSPTGWVAKVDQGIKKRMKQGLVAIDVDAAGAKKAIGAWKKKGFSQFILEPLFPHEASEEQYLSLERVREGIRVLHAQGGGIDIESHPEAVTNIVVSDASAAAAATKLPLPFLERLFKAFNDSFFAFLEINPLIVRGDEVTLLDAAVLVDSAGEFFTKAWTRDDVVQAKLAHPAEEAVAKLSATTPAQLALKVLNKDGALFFLFSGGGGSIVIADEVQAEGAGKLIGNYGEYSGGPSREETHLYAREIIKLMLASRPPAGGKKALVIAGGVANFTDIKKTFAGIIDALSENADTLRKQGIKVFIRRGGPNEKAGLALMQEFLTKEKLLGSIYGSDTIITKAVEDALAFVHV